MLFFLVVEEIGEKKRDKRYIEEYDGLLRTASLIIGYSFHDLFPFLRWALRVSSLFTTHRSFVFVWTLSVDCHSLEPRLNSLPVSEHNFPRSTNRGIRKEERKED